MTLERWVLLVLGGAVLLLSLTRFGARLKPTQMAGAGAGLLLVLAALLPLARISVLGNSVEPVAARKDEVNTSAAVDDALAKRLDTLERKVAVLTSSASTEAQKRSVVIEDARAKGRYDAAAAAAEQARHRYLQSLNPFVPVPRVLPR